MRACSAFLWILVGACGASAGGADASTAIDAAAGVDGAVTDAAGATCQGAGFAGNEPVVHVTVATGTVHDLAAAPIGNLPVTILGVDLALAGKTSGAGGFSLAINQNLKRPALIFGDGLTYARLAAPVTTGAPDLALVDAPLPATGAAIAAGATATSGPLTLAVPTGASVAIDTLTYDTPDKQQLRAVAIPIASESAVVPAAMNFELLIGVAPVDSLFCPPATLTVPNSPGWPANAAVEVFGLETDVGQEWAPFGQWGKLADGHVSADGLTISAPLAVLKNLALRRAP